MHTPFHTPWPYPRWIAHRGAGKLAPENTLAAFKLGAQHGYRMFECDVKLSSDDVPFLLHDDTLERTTNARTALGAHASTVGGAHPWSTLAQLDAGSWHSAAFAQEPIPTLAQVAAFCLHAQCHLNIEIKPTPGTERHTAEVIAQHAAKLWKGAVTPPLLSSFAPQALEGALAAQPELPRALLLDTLWDGWLETAQRLGCVAIVCNYRLWTADTVKVAHAAGFRTMSYTANDARVVQHLLDLGTDGIITDKVDVFKPTDAGLTTDLSQ